MAKETLTCEYEPKPHKWSRESTRGRKPRFCAKHKPEVTPTSAPASGPRILHCELGNHDWEREPTRGRAPANCPEHKPEPIGHASEKVQTLHCQIGNHDWERVSARGRAPINCPEHKPVPIQSSRSANGVLTMTVNGMRTLHCELGNHDWERAPQRGRVPSNCPAHSAVPPRSVPVRIVSDSFPLADIPEEELPLVEVEGEYESETTPEEQREILSAAFSQPSEKRRPGRPRIHETPEEAAEAALAKSRARVDELELSLKANGTHLSQQAPYKLYKLVSGVAGTKGARYEYVRDFSPLAREQFLNQFEDRFLAKIYYFERDGEKVES